MIFQCKNCGGNVIYSPEKKGMFCPFCESGDSEVRKDSEGDIRICPNCGGEVPAEEHTSATQCPYCDNYIIFNERVEGQFAPDQIIPFQYSRDMVKKLMREKFAGCVFAPVDFLSEARLNSMEGDYVPFWLFDYDVACVYHGEGRRIRCWTNGEIEYTETSIYDIYRDMDIKFQKIPADASVKMPDNIMDLMEPYRYDQLTQFRPEYMSGFQGEKYNMTSELIENRAKAKMEEDAVALLKETIAGYGSVSDRQKEVRVAHRTASYGLLPVWIYQYHYKDKTYPFYINGQTAKIVGRTPVSVAKVWTYGLTVWASLTSILGLLYGIYMLV